MIVNNGDVPIMTRVRLLAHEAALWQVSPRLQLTVTEIVQPKGPNCHQNLLARRWASVPRGTAVSSCVPQWQIRTARNIQALTFSDVGLIDNDNLCLRGALWNKTFVLKALDVAENATSWSTQAASATVKYPLLLQLRPIRASDPIQYSVEGVEA